MTPTPSLMSSATGVPRITLYQGAHGLSLGDRYGHATPSAGVLNQTTQVQMGYAAELPHTHNPHSLIDVGSGAALAALTAALALRARLGGCHYSSRSVDGEFHFSRRLDDTS